MNTTHVDIGLARYSDWAFTSAVVVLVVALLLLAVELAYTRSRTRRHANWSAPGRWRADSAHPRRGRPTPRGGRSTNASAGPGWPWSTLGIGLLLACIVLRGLATHAGAVGQHVRVHQPDLLLRAGRRRDRAAPPAVPPAVGVPAAAGADPADGVRALALHQRRAGDARAAVLLAAHPRVGGQPGFGGVPGRRAWPASCSCCAPPGWASPTPTGALARLVQRLPDAQTLDRIAYRTTIFAFPVFGFGVIFGAIWAEEAWGRYWGWDPKETVSFIAWVVYAAYLHARSTAGWRDRKAAWINVVGSWPWCSICSSSTW